MIVVPALLQVAHAGGASHFILPDTAGNVVVNGDFDEINGSDWTVLANGGSTSPFSVKIKSGASLTGEEFRRNGVEVTTEGYTIQNSGSLDVGEFGILSTVGNTQVQNQTGGVIQGGYNGIDFTNGRIETVGLNLPVASEEIPGNTVVNDGSILGNSTGIYSESSSTLTVENHASGVITGNSGAGISAESGLIVTNDGLILGSAGTATEETFKTLRFGNGSGISAGSDAQITNRGIITGVNGSGINAYDGLVVENTGAISGLGIQDFREKISLFSLISVGNGISTGDNAVIVNRKSGSISGRVNGISAGSNLDLTNHGTISGTSAEGGYAGVSAFIGANILNSGTISGDQYGIILNNQQALTLNTLVQAENEIIPSSTITNSGTITGGQSAILLGYGENVVNLDFGSTMLGDIRGGEGNDTLNFLSGSETPKQQDNIVHGSVFGIETITKSESGYAFIGGPGESVEVFADTINISGGGLIINGSLASQSEGKTQVTLTGDGKLDGTGTWKADIAIGSGGLSAGFTSSPLSDGDAPAALKSATVGPDVDTTSSVGFLTINGNVGSTLPVIDPPILGVTAAAAPVQSAGYLRVDIHPQTDIVNGVNSDIIYHTGAGNTFDVTGLDIQLAPTDINKTLTEGKYTIVDSENPLVGVDAIGNVGVHFGSNVPDTGPFRATGGGENDQSTVLTQYFTTIETEDPVDDTPLPTRVALATAAAFDPNNSNLVVNIQHDYANLPGLTKNQAALGAAIDGLVNNPSPILQDFIAALDYSDLASVQSTLAALDPSATLGLANSVVNSNYRLHRLTQEHLAAIRGNGREYTDTAPSSKDAKGVITPGASTVHSTGRGNAWGSFSYDGQDNEGADNNADYDGTAGAFTAGVDWLFAPKFVAGIVLDGSKGNYDADNYSSDIDSFRGAAYATYGGATGFYSDALAGFGTHNLDSSLGASGVLIGSTSNNTDADSFQAMWTAGYTMGDSKVKHGPFGGFEYQKVSVDGYTQGGPLAINVGSYDVESLRALIGYRVNAEFGKFRPYASAAYAHEFEDGANHATATLGGVAFRVSGADQSSAFILTAGTAYTLTEALTLDLGYRGDIATDDGITSNGGSIGVNYSF
ncbi:MAG: autotransporter outer membrane beta-barrel domain-containing protein [Luteolibacter sp.]